MENFKILKSDNELKLEEEVNKYLFNGYSLNGSFKAIYCPNKNKIIFFQSIKRDNKLIYHWSDWE